MEDEKSLYLVGGKGVYLEGVGIRDVEEDSEGQYKIIRNLSNVFNAIHHLYNSLVIPLKFLFTLESKSDIIYKDEDEIVRRYVESTIATVKENSVIIHISINENTKAIFDKSKAYRILNDLTYHDIHLLGLYISKMLREYAYKKKKEQDEEYMIDVLRKMDSIDVNILEKGAKTLLAKNIILYNRRRTRRKKGEVKVLYTFEDFIRSGAYLYALLSEYYLRMRKNEVPVITILSREDRYRFFVDVFYISLVAVLSLYKEYREN